jgi:signal peptidase I
LEKQSYMDRSTLTPSNLRKGPHGPGRSIAYIGPSMNPTFRSGDLLQVIPYQGRKIRRGDVIAFIPPDEGQRIIHRVSRVNSNGITTQGDNSSQTDPWVLTSAQIEGRVAYARRGNRGWEVAGGSMGRFSADLVRTMRLLDRGISAFFRPTYHWIARNTVLTRFLHPIIATRIVFFRTYP